MRPSASPRAMRVTCRLALAALALMAWSLFDPSPLPVMVALSAGQALGIASLLAYVAIVVADLRRAHLDRRPEGDDGP
jgi:hypothetical protein